MGLLLEILLSFFDLPWGAPGRRRVRRVLRKGRPLTGRIDALKFGEPTRDEPSPRHYVGVIVIVDGREVRAAVRQRLWPYPEEGRLGSEVVVCELRGRIAIDWAATLRSRGIVIGDTEGAERLLRKPLKPGVDDGRLDRRRLRKGERVEAVLVAAEQRLGRSGSPTDQWNIELSTLDGGAPLIIRKAFVPDYVRHLLAAGTRLPVAVHGQRLAVDWPEAAARDAALGPAVAALAA